MKRNRRRKPEKNSSTSKTPVRERRRGASDGRAVFLDKLRSYLQNHWQLFFNTFQRLAAEPVQTLMTSLVVAIALGLPAALYVGVINLQQLGSRVETISQMTVFLKTDSTQAAIDQLQKKLVSDVDIAKVDYISRQQALEEFRSLSGFGNVLDMLDENPLPPVFIVQAGARFQNDLAASETLVAKLQGMALVDDVMLDMKWMQRLQAMLEVGERLAFSLGLALALGVLLIIGNTIRLAIENRRDEIVVVKLVGGTNAYVRRPFLYTGIWYGVIGGMLAWVLVALGLQWISGPVERLAELYQSFFHLIGLGFVGLVALLLIGAGLGLLGAWLAVARHLSSIEPK
ncbi:MAG: permease-like cell division protein FtsX [Porticoccus sp.]|nr:permease-like cell division protein FtsX [Porticoccus sp.]